MEKLTSEVSDCEPPRRFVFVSVFDPNKANRVFQNNVLMPSFIIISICKTKIMASYDTLTDVYCKIIHNLLYKLTGLLQD